MQIHLIEFKSDDPSISQIGNDRLQVGLTALVELGQTYWEADYFYQLFITAQNEVQTQKLGQQIPESIHD